MGLSMHILTTITKLLLIGSHLPVTRCNEAGGEQVCLRRDVLYRSSVYSMIGWRSVCACIVCIIMR